MNRDRMLIQIICLWGGMSFPAWFGIPLTRIHLIVGLIITLVLLVFQWLYERRQQWRKKI